MRSQHPRPALMLFLAGTLTLLAVPTFADLTAPQIHGQIRPRFEARDAGKGSDDAFTSMRVRLDAGTTLDGGVRTFVQLQDVRLWGEETNTLGDYSADNLDLHQGYAEFTDVAGTPLGLRIGRQEIALGGQRLVGTVGWAQQGRAFDGVRASLSPAGGQVDLLALRLADGSAATHTDDARLLGVHAELSALAGAQLYALQNTNGSATDQWTLGARKAGKAAGLSYRVEGAYQTGERNGEDVAATMVGARLGTNLAGGKATATAWVDLLSGDDDPADGETKVFDTLFATNHKFYGYADLFLNLPVHTAGRGLRDVALKFTLSPAEGWKLAADLHSFAVMADEGISESRLGEEIDLTVKYGYSADATWTAGVSYVNAGDGLTAIGRPDDDLLWAYVMTDVQF